MEAQVDTVTESDEIYEAVVKPKRGVRGLLLVLLIVGSIAAGGAAGALGLLAPLHALALGHGATATPSPTVFHALPEFYVAIDALSEYQASAPRSSGRHLRAVVQLEVGAEEQRRIEALQPRIVDALLTFLHALNEHDLASVRSLDRLKAQMLHRVRQVTGNEAVRGVLITDLAVL
jgi:flagellar basal body-associated protein FliL